METDGLKYVDRELCRCGCHMDGRAEDDTCCTRCPACGKNVRHGFEETHRFSCPERAAVPLPSTISR